MTAAAPSTAVLVTGGTGFVGRALVDALSARGLQVRVLSRQERRSPQANVVIWRGELTSAADLAPAVRGCSVVYHCAAEKNDPARMAHVNVTGTRMLFDLAREHGVNLFCHLSSVGVIGRTAAEIVDENTPCNPMNRYEETKLAAEGIVKAGIADGRVIILRPTNVFGAETVRGLLRDAPSVRARLWLRGRERAHLVYVADVAAAALHWLTASPAAATETFIVSSDEDSGNTHREVQAWLASQVRSAPPAPSWPAPAFLPYWARLLRHGRSNNGGVVYSAQKLRNTGFRFPYGLRAGLADALQRAMDGATAVAYTGRAS